MVFLPQLELLAVFSRKSGHDNMSMRCNSICPYNKYEHTQFHTGMGAQAQTDCVYMHFLSFFSNNLASHTHMLYHLATLYFCVSRYEHNKECSGMHTHRSQGHSSRCLVNAEESLLQHYLLQYKQCALLETIDIRFQYMIC